MTETPDIKSRIEQTISEDAIIKGIMLDYPELYDMLEFNEFTIKEKLEMNAYWFQNFRLLWIKEKKKLNHINILMEEHIGKLYHQLRFEGDINLGKIEVEKYYIPADEMTIKFRKSHLNQTIRVETFEAIAKAFEKQGFTMNSFIKNMEL